MRASTSSMKEVTFGQMFFALIFCLLGWALLEAWLLVVHAGPAVHIVVSSWALCIAGASLVRHRRYRKNTGELNPPSAQERHGLGASDVGRALLLLALGGLLGICILGGSTVILGLVAAGMLFIPWSRIPVYAGNSAASCLVTLLGAGVVLAVGRSSISLTFLPIASWVLWTCACVAVLRQPGSARRTAHDIAAKATDAMHG